MIRGNEPAPPASQTLWLRNRRLILLCVGAAVSAITGAALALLLPLCEADGGRGVSCFSESGGQAMLHTTPPALASVLALLLLRWRFARSMAAGLLWFWAVFFVGAFVFYVVPAVPQTTSLFTPFRK